MVRTSLKPVPSRQRLGGFSKAASLCTERERMCQRVPREHPLGRDIKGGTPLHAASSSA